MEDGWLRCCMTIITCSILYFFSSSSSRSKVTPSLPLAISNPVNVDERSVFFFFLARDSRDKKK